MIIIYFTPYPSLAQKKVYFAPFLYTYVYNCLSSMSVSEFFVS